MSKKELNSFNYEDEYLRYESYLKGFSKEKFDEFDAIAKKIGLDSKIKDLMDSKIVIGPTVEVKVEYIGFLKETATWDWAAKLYISSGNILFIKLVSDDESIKSE